MGSVASDFSHTSCSCWNPSFSWMSVNAQHPSACTPPPLSCPHVPPKALITPSFSNKLAPVLYPLPYRGSLAFCKNLKTLVSSLYRALTHGTQAAPLLGLRGLDSSLMVTHTVCILHALDPERPLPFALAASWTELGHICFSVLLFAKHHLNYRHPISMPGGRYRYRSGQKKTRGSGGPWQNREARSSPRS